jgi:hypothetical protein
LAYEQFSSPEQFVYKPPASAGITVYLREEKSIGKSGKKVDQEAASN